jgi:serine/threonine-protein kinase HipA
MRKAKVYYKNEEAGLLIQQDDGSFLFRYNDSWFFDGSKSPVSLTFPKTKQEYFSESLFPFFYNMLPEGSNKQSIIINKRIDENDAFGILIETANADSIGAVTVVRIE